LLDLGYVECQNLSLQIRDDHNDTSRYEEIAAEFAGLPLRAVFVPRELHFVRAMKAVGAKKTVPIVAILVTPVEIGEVREIGRHGSNVTGILLVPLEIYAKRLQLLKEAAPRIRRVLALHQTPKGYLRRTEVFVERLTSAAKSQGLTILLRAVEAPEDIDRVVAGAVREGVDSLITAQDAFFLIHRQKLAMIAAKHNLPSISGETGYAVAGGLMDYGPSIPRVFRDSAIFVDKILKGAEAAELPIRQPTRFDLAVNLKTAKALGIEVPRSILLRATEVIE
jgi:putative ABC transport system substrate-binding protein